MATGTSRTQVQWPSCRRTGTSPRPARSRHPTRGQSGSLSRASSCPPPWSMIKGLARSFPTPSTRRCSSMPGTDRQGGDRRAGERVLAGHHRPHPVQGRDRRPTEIALQTGDLIRLPTAKGPSRWTAGSAGSSFKSARRLACRISLGAIGAAVLGLCLSLFVRPRRVWIKIADRKGPSVVEVGGLDRADARAGLTDDVAELAGQLGRPEPGLAEGSKGSGTT